MISKKIYVLATYSLLLILVFFVREPSMVFSETIEITDTNLKVSPYKSGVSIVKELREKRTRNSKTFLNSDNTKTLMASSHSLHFNTKGQWQDINTEVKLSKQNSDFSYISDENAFIIKFGKTSNKGIQISNEGETINYMPLGANLVGATSRKDSRIIYSNLWNQTDLYYQVNEDALKMLLYLKNNQAPKRFQFEIKMNNLDLVENRDKSIDFKNHNGITVFTIPAMWVQDSASDDLHYDRLKVTLAKKNNKSSIITITLDDNGLKYPITIDPSTTTGWANPSSMSLSVALPSIHKNDIKTVSFICRGIKTTGVEEDTYCNKAIRIDENFNFLPDAALKSATITGPLTYPGTYITGLITAYADGAPYPPYFSGFSSRIILTYQDDIAPLAPTNLIGSVVDQTNVNLTWTPAIDNYLISYYNVYMIKPDGTTALLAMTDQSNYLKTNLLPLQTYQFYIVAVDNARNMSVRSDTIAITMPMTYKYIYSEGRLVKILKVDGTQLVQFIYDSNGNLIQSQQ